MKNLYVVPFLGIGRRITLDVDFRYREIGYGKDKKVIEYDHKWHKEPWEDYVPEQVFSWASVLCTELERAQTEGYILVSTAFDTIGEAIFEMDRIKDLYISGNKEEQLSIVREFFMLLHKFHRDGY